MNQSEVSIIARILVAAAAIDRENLSNAQVHVCDVNDDAVRRKSLYGIKRELSEALFALATAKSDLT